MSGVVSGNVKNGVSDGAERKAIPRNDNGDLESPLSKDRGIHAKYDPKANDSCDKSEVCDCTRDNCVGCFFPCETCSSVKCGGTVCHKNRPVGRYVVEKD